MKNKTKYLIQVLMSLSMLISMLKVHNITWDYADNILSKEEFFNSIASYSWFITFASLILLVFNLYNLWISRKSI